jgi:hypothetical protein
MSLAMRPSFLRSLCGSASLCASSLCFSYIFVAERGFVIVDVCLAAVDEIQVCGLKQLARGQIPDQPPVGREKFVLGKFFELDPFELMEDFVLEFAFEGRHGEELQIDGAPMAVIMSNVGYARTDSGANAELFLQFTDQCLLGTFAWFNLPAGKLPLQRHGLVGAALADEHQAIPNQQACNHEPKRGAGRARVGNRPRLFHSSSVNARRPSTPGRRGSPFIH